MSTLAVSVWRGGADGQFQTFTLDPTLAYRFTCHVGMCGFCAMMVNGQPGWTCRALESAPLAQRRLPRSA